MYTILYVSLYNKKKSRYNQLNLLKFFSLPHSLGLIFTEKEKLT